MQADTFTMSSGGTLVFVRRWLPGGVPRAAVQIAHGMAEHSGRYARLAEALTARGMAVYASDHRGHGQTALRPADLGHFADRHGWEKVVEDLWHLTLRIAAAHPGRPILLLGHSMGSFLAQDFIARHGDALAGVALSGTSGKPPPQARAGRAIAYAERLRLGRQGRSALLTKLSFGDFNKAFAPARTPFDWLSRDAAEVDRYIADPLCGFPCTTGLWLDLLAALERIARAEHVARVPKDLPVLVFSGALDPVGAATRGPQALLAAYRDAGLKNLSHKFYPDGRHESLNDTNRDEVTADFLAWAERVIGS